MESISKTESETKLLQLCERTLEAEGFRTVDVDLLQGGKSLIRVFIERKGIGSSSFVSSAPDREGVSIDDCAQASRLLGPLIDAEELVPGAYDLEVSSPGLDRRLRTALDFQSVIGEIVKLRLVETIPGVGANATGTLLRLEEDKLFLSISGKEVAIPLASIKRANRVWNPR